MDFTLIQILNSIHRNKNDCLILAECNECGEFIFDFNEIEFLIRRKTGKYYLAANVNSNFDLKNLNIKDDNELLEEQENDENIELIDEDEYEDYNQTNNGLKFNNFEAFSDIAFSNVKCKNCSKIIGYQAITFNESTTFLCNKFLYENDKLRFLYIDNLKSFYFDKIKLEKEDELKQLKEYSKNYSDIELFDTNLETTKTLENVFEDSLNLNSKINALEELYSNIQTNFDQVIPITEDLLSKTDKLVSMYDTLIKIDLD